MIPPPPTHVVVDREPFSLSRALDGLFMRARRSSSDCSHLASKAEPVLQGAPGVGKSFVARRLAYSLIGELRGSEQGPDDPVPSVVLL